MSIYKPPFLITPEILDYCLKISRELGVLSGRRFNVTPLELRRTNNIKTIQASLSIEGNTLSLDQVTDILDGKRVIGPEKDILEVKNALFTYDHIKKLNPLQISDLLDAHKMLMSSLTGENGTWRSGNVGIFDGKSVCHVAPPAKRVPDLMESLFNFLMQNTSVAWLIKACVFHYELEFIHPFTDGNGRMGRLWQQLLLMKEDPVFEYIPVEVLIKERQKDYYTSLGESDKRGDSTPFLIFSLETILEAILAYGKTSNLSPRDWASRIEEVKHKIERKMFSRKEYMTFHKDISTATASRDLKLAVDNGILSRTGDKNNTQYKFIF